MFFTTFLNMLILILKPILGSERPKRAKMSPREPSGASKNQKPSFTKTLKNQLFFNGFWLQRPLKKASRGRRRLPKGTQRNPRPQKRDPKLDPKIIKFWTNFGAHFGTQKHSKNKPEKTTFLGDPSPASQGSK